MMKNKILLFVICLFCFFGFKLNTKAASKTFDYNFENTNFINYVKNYESYYNEIVSTIEEYNTYNLSVYLAVHKGMNGSVNFGVCIINRSIDYFYYQPFLNNSYTLYDGSTYFELDYNGSDHSNYSSSPIVIGGNSSFFQKYLSVNIVGSDAIFNLSEFETFLTELRTILTTGSSTYSRTGRYSDFTYTNYVYTSDYFNTNFFYVLYANFGIKYVNNLNYSNLVSYDIQIDDTIYTYNDFIPTYYDYISSLTPTLSVSNLTPVKDNYNNIIKYYVDVSFSIFDTNNYKFQYCLDNFCDDFLENNTRLELYQNGSYSFQILDNNDELIDSTSLTISNINIETPFIDYTLSVPDSCVAYIDNVSRNMCKSIKMEWGTSNPNYIYQYSVNNLDFENIYGSYSLLLVQNDTVVMRVIDNDNDVLWSQTLTINDLYTIDNSLGIFTTFNQTNFGKNESVSNYLEVYIYNLDLSYIDNVYISYDGFNFTKLDVLNRATFFYGLSKALYSSQQVYINIKDNNNEIIYSTSYYVDMSKVANKGLLSYLENFNLGMTGPISTFVTTPIRFFQNILNNSSVCTPLVLPSRIGNLSLPCMKSVYSSISIDLYNIIETIFSGILVYYCGLSIIKTLKSLVSPTDDRIEVVDL